MNILLIAILTCFLVINGACQPKVTVKPAEPIDIGSVAGNVYTNKALGFKIKFPETMVLDTREELDQGLKDGVELMKQGESEHGTAIQQMEREERIVFGLNTPESEPAGAMNISVIKGPGVGPFKDMVARTLQVFVDSTKSTIVKPIGDETVSGQSFATFVTSMELQSAKVYSKVYSIRRNDHRISISISYADEQGFLPLEKVLNGIEFF